MAGRDEGRYTAFEGSRRLAAGALAELAMRAKEAMDRQGNDLVLIFDDATGEQVEPDLRGTVADVRARLVRPEGVAEEGATAARGPGRPKLGVVAREVTLLPRHWAWLNEQPGGASVALRKLVEEARRANEGKDRVRRSREAAYRFIAALAGNLPGFEETTRALFAGDRGGFAEHSRSWPDDVRAHAEKLAADAFETGEASA